MIRETTAEAGGNDDENDDETDAATDTEENSRELMTMDDDTDYDPQDDDYLKDEVGEEFDHHDADSDDAMELDTPEKVPGMRVWISLFDILSAFN